MNEDYAVSIDLSVLPLPSRNNYMKTIRTLNIPYLLENQVLKFSHKNLTQVTNEFNDMHKKGVK